jgi:O-antigen ligase
MGHGHTGGNGAADSLPPVPILLSLVLLIALTLAMLPVGGPLSALAAGAVFAAATWRADLALVGAVPGAMLAGAAGLSVVFLVGLPLVTALVAALLAGRLRVDGRRHLAMAGLGAWILASVFLVPAAPFLQNSRTSDALTLVLGLTLAAYALAVAPSTKLLRVTVLVCSSLLALGVVLGTHAVNLEGRPTAYGLNPNYLGLVFALGLVCTVVEFRRGRRLLAALAVAAQLAGLVETASRGAMMALGCGLAAYAAGQLSTRGSRERRLPWVAAALIVGVAMAAVVLGVTTAGFASRSGSGLETNNASRQAVAELAVRLSAENPVTGIGYGNFPAEALAATGWYMNTHNEYLRLTAEMGLPALVLFLLVLAGLRGRGREPEWRWTIPLVVTYLAGLLTVNALSNLAVSVPFWLALGALSSERLRAEVMSAVPPRRTPVAAPAGLPGLSSPAGHAR